jgi:hypothetical protein
MPARPQALVIPGPVGALEALIETPEAPLGVAVICHPHPQHGGTLHNKVVHTLARALQSRGLVSVRFNYRGVGASAGDYDAGRGECEDALAVCAWSRQRWPGLPLTLAGFSFGALVALRAAASVRPARLISVAPAIAHLEGEFTRPKCPWLIVQGEADEIVDAQAVVAWARRFTPPPQLRLLPGVGHFFHGQLEQLRDAVLETQSPGSFDQPGSTESN